MFAGLGRLVDRRRLSVLFLCLVFVAVSGGWGSGAIARLKSGGFDDPHSSSSLVAKLSAQYFSNSTPDVFVIYRSDRMTIDDPRFRGKVDAALARLPQNKIRNVLTYWSQTPRVAELAAKDRHATFAAIQLAGDDTAKTRAYDAMRAKFAVPGLSVRVGGGVPLAEEFNTQTQRDLSRAETISFPALLVLMLFVFGSAGAFWLPLVVGVFSIVGALTVLRLLTMITDVSSFSAEVITMMGLGLAIDYSLFIVNRFREELAHAAGGSGPAELRALSRAQRRTALANTMTTAGRTIAFSGITVTTALLGLLLFPQMFLRSVGLGGMAVVAVAVVGAMTLLPALLSLLGHRVEFGRMPWRRRARHADRRTGGPWYRLATSVMRHPVLYFTGVMAILCALTMPFLHVRFGTTDVRVLPASSPNRQLYEAFQREFPTGSKDPIDVVLSGEIIPKNFVPSKKHPIPQFITAYEGRLRHLPGVSSVEITGYAQKYAAVRISVRHDYGAMSDQARGLVRRIRAMPVQREGMYADVGGPTAAQMDLMDSLRRGLPTVGAIIGLVTFVLLFAAFGSVLLPIKAVAMNLLSLGASFGAIVWGFQDGHLAGVLGFTSTGTIEPTTIILVLLTVFGLSMDYEVFLLSRIREEWDRTGDNRRAVAVGLQRTGGIISSAALLFLVVIGAFSTAQIVLVKLIGVGMFAAIVVDASLVRMLLVPATMRFLGRANWWPRVRPAYATAGVPAPPSPPPPEPERLRQEPERLRQEPDRVPEEPNPLDHEPVPVRRRPVRGEKKQRVRQPPRVPRHARVLVPAEAPAQDEHRPPAGQPEPTLADEILRRVAAANGRTPPLTTNGTRAPAPSRVPHRQREIVPNPEGPGWHWKTPED